MNKYHVEIPKSGYRGFNYSIGLIVKASISCVIDGRLIFLNSDKQHIACFEPGQWLWFCNLEFLQGEK